MSTVFPRGGCSCGEIRYELRRTPLIVHCCHCRYCQRETGAAFATNLLIEAQAVQLLRGTPSVIPTASYSGEDQMISRCPSCQIAIWSNYRDAKDIIRFVRLGTLDEPDRFAPDIHIFVASKQPWLRLPPDAVAVPEFYRWSAVWSTQSLQRRKLASPAALGHSAL